MWTSMNVYVCAWLVHAGMRACIYIYVLYIYIYVCICMGVAGGYRKMSQRILFLMAG